MRARLTALALAVGALAACGTTVPAAERAALTTAGSLTGTGPAPRAETDLGSAGPGDAGSTGTADVPGTAVGTPTGVGGTSSAPRSGADAGRPRADGSTSGPSGPSGPSGTTARSPGRNVGASPVPRGGNLVIGFPTRKGGAAAASAVGIQGASTGDLENQVRAVAASINARGGILGRKVTLAPHDSPAVESNPATADAAACASWQERKAFVVINVTARPVLRSCLAKAGIPIISSLSISSAATLYGDRLPGVYAPSSMSIDRSVTAVIDRLVARRFFTGWDHTTGRPGALPVKIGMQSFEDADGQHVVAVTRRALAKHGLALDVVEAHSADLNDNSSSTSAAVLRFRARGVTHVIDANLIFFQTAASQDYKPRYVVQDTINTPALLAQNVPASQLHGAMGAGYLPLYEVEDPKDPSPEATRCKALMKAAGEDTAQPVALVFMLHTCDAVYFLEKALTAGGEVSAAALRTGAASLGAQPSHLTYGSLVSAGRRDGATRVRDFDYVDACTCFQHPSTTTYRAD